MKMRTKLASYLLAGIMAFSTVLPMMSTIASADSAGEGAGLGSGTPVTVKNSNFATHVNGSQQPAIAVYLSGSAYLTDGSDLIVKSDDGKAELKGEGLASFIVNGGDLDTFRLTGDSSCLGTDYSWANDCRNKNNMILFFPNTDHDNYSDENGMYSKNFFVATSANTATQVSGFYTNMNSNKCISNAQLNDTKDKTWNAWRDIFKYVGRVKTLDTEGVKYDLGQQISKGYKEFRTSHNSDDEYELLIKPIIDVLGADNASVKKIQNRISKGLPVTLVVEAYYPNSPNAGTRMYFSQRAFDTATAYRMNNSAGNTLISEQKGWGAASNTTYYAWTDSNKTSRAVTFGYYYALAGGALANGFMPAWNEKVDLSGETHSLYAPRGDNEYARYTPAGIGYFSLCNDNPPETPRLSVTVTKSIDVDGDESAIDVAEEAQAFEAHISAPFTLNTLNTVMTGSDESASALDTKNVKEVAKALASYLGDDVKGYSAKLTALAGAYMATSSRSKGVGLPGSEYNTADAFGSFASVDGETPYVTFDFEAYADFMTDGKKTVPIYYVIYETGSGNEVGGYTTEWKTGAAVLAKLTKTGSGESTAYKWSFNKISTNGGATSTCSSSDTSLTVNMVNSVKLSSDPVPVNLEVSGTTVLDVDRYYVTGYDATFDYINNEQCVYVDTRSALSKSNLGYVHSWHYSSTSSPYALNFSASDIVSNLETKDNNTKNSSITSTGAIGGLYAPIVDKLTNFTKKDGYTWNFGLINGVSSFTVKKDYVRKYDVDKVSGSVDHNTAQTIANSTNKGNFGTPVDKVILSDGATISSDLPTTGTTYQLSSSVLTTSDRQSADAVLSHLNEYSDYAKNYALYEAMISTSGQNINKAMRYYNKAALALYRRANGLASEVYSDESAWEEPKGGYAHAKADNSDAARSKITEYNNANKAKAQKAETEIKTLSKALKSLTGWEFKYCVEYVVKSVSSTHTNHNAWTWHCNSSYCSSRVNVFHCYDWSHTVSREKNGQLKNGRPEKGITTDTSGGSTSVGKLSNALRGIVKAGQTGDRTGAWKIGGIYADLIKDASLMQSEMAKLELERPYAEVHIITRYETPLDAANTYKNVDVSEYMVAMWWKDQLPFMKGDSRLATVVDWAPYSAASASMALSKARLIEGNVSSNSTLVMNEVSPAKTKLLSGVTYYTLDTNGKSTERNRPIYSFLVRNRTGLSTMDEFLEAVKTAGSSIASLVQNKATEVRYSYEPGDYFVTKKSKIYSTNLDSIGYLQANIGIWTTIWAMDDANPTDTVLPTSGTKTSWRLPTKVATDVLNTKQNAVVSIYKPKEGNISATGADSVKNIGWIINYASTGNMGKKPLLSDTLNNLKGIFYYTDTTMTGDAENYFFFSDGVTGRHGVEKTFKYLNGKLAGDEIGLDSKLEVYLSSTPYKIETTFKHFNVGDAEGVDDLVAGSTYDEDDDKFWDNHSKAYGYYTRESTGSFNVYPLVKRAYYNNAHQLAYTYVVGQKPREIKSNVFYQVGLVGTATPTVVTNAPAAGSMATGLANSYGAGSVSYSGAGITITYEPDVSMYFQTYALEDEDIREAYQSEWGNDAWIAADDLQSAHDEWLESMGATKRNVDTGTDTEIGVWTIPYIAGAETALKANRGDSWTTGKWVLDQDGAKLALADNSDPLTRTVNIRLYVEGGELVGIYIPADYVDSDGATVYSGYYTQAGKQTDDSTLTAVDEKGEFKGWTTSDFIETLRRNGDTWHTRDIAKALYSMGITGGGDCLLRKSFVNGVGANVVADYNENTATGLMLNDNQKSYNEYTYSLCLKVETTKFRLQTLMFTDKLPAEYGPSTPADKSQYFTDGYGFQASALLLKIGDAGEDADVTGVAKSFGDMVSILDNTWRINRTDGDGDTQSDAVDLVIGNVDVTAAN